MAFPGRAWEREHNCLPSRSWMMRYAACSLVVLVIATPSQAQRKAVEGRNGMVVAVSPPAADVGLEMLKKGGNAVDAAVATAFAMAVTWPSAGNIGGGGFMIVRSAREVATAFDYRETAP